MVAKHPDALLPMLFSEGLSGDLGDRRLVFVVTEPVVVILVRIAVALAWRY